MTVATIGFNENEYRARNRAIAGFRGYIHDPQKPRKPQNAEPLPDGDKRFVDRSYRLELTNGYVCLTVAVRERAVALGHSPSRYNC